MSLRDGYLRVKGRWKQKLGMNSANASSTSVAQETRRSRSPSPMPQPLSQPHPRSPNNTISLSSLQDPPSHTSQVPLITFPSPVLVISGPDTVPHTEAPTESVTPITITKEKQLETTFERTKSAAWSGLRSLLQVLETSSGVFPPLKSAVGGLNRFIEVFETASQGRREFEELIITLLGLLEDTGAHVSNKGDPGMTNSVKNLWTGLDEELKIVESKYNRGGILRIEEALDDSEEIAKCHRRIHGHLERLALNANLSMWETVNESATETRLKGLSPALSAVYNSAESEKVKRRECTPGTREKALDKLLGWARNKSPEAEDVYWMNGMAGTGKTTIACSLCAELEKSSELGASFFCSRLLPECRDVNLIIPCVAYQLARFSIPFYHALSDILKGDPDVHTRVLKTQFEDLLVKPLNQVKNTLPTGFVIVIDALDECDSEDSIGQILDLLLSHTATPDLPVRFLLSSRPESKIYQKMMARVGHSFQARLVLHDLDVQAVKLDIKTYLEAELAFVDLTSAQLTKLVDLSGVLFIFASTTARYIVEGQELMEVEERLAMVLGLSSECTSDKDRAIDQLYTSILQAVSQKKNVSKQTWTRLKIILDTVVCAQEPLTADGLAGLLGEKSGKHVEALLRQLSSILDISESTGLVTSLHASFPDYMLEAERSLSFHCNPIVTHTRLSYACLETMKTKQPQFNICALESSYLADDRDAELNKRADRAVSLHLFYACRYWIVHLELSEQSDKPEERLWDFLSKRLLLWMEVLNLKKRIHLGPNIILRAENWSKTNACSEDTIQLAHDAWRFVTMFAGHVVSQSTPHIYVSMLPFWPLSSPISKHYQPRMYGGAHPQGTAMTRRRLALLATWMFDAVVYVVCFSPDGLLIAVGASSSLHIIDSITGHAVLGPLPHDDIVRTVTFSPDGTLLATGSQSRSIQMWVITNGDLVWQELEAHTDYVISLSFLPDGTRLVSGGADGSLRVWAVGTGDIILGPINGHESAIMSISVSSDGTLVASGSTDKTIKVWDTQTGVMMLGPLEGHTDRIDSVCFSPDGLRLVSGSWDNDVRVWNDLSAPATSVLLQGHTGCVHSVAFSPNGQYIVSGSGDHTVRIWSGCNNLDCVAILRGHMDTVLSAVFSYDGLRIVSGSHDKTVRVWDAYSHNATSGSPLSGHTGSVTSVGISHDGRRILSSSIDRTLCVWDAQSGQLVVGPFVGHTNWVYSACLSPDDNQIVSGSDDGILRWWDAHDGSLVGEPVTGHTGAIRSVCYSADGTLVASGATDNTIRLWNTQSHEIVGTPLHMHEDFIWSVCFSLDGLRLVSGSDDNTVMIWNLETRQLALPPLRGHSAGLASVCVSPDGTRIASSSLDKTIRLWEAESGRELMSPLRGHSGPVNAVKFSPDSRYIVSCSGDRSLRIWSAQTGEAVGSPLSGHTESVFSVHISSCSRWVVSGSIDKSIRVWDVGDLIGAPESKEMLQDDVQSDNQTSKSFESWILQDDGWVVDSQKHLLAWVPPDLRHVLMSPRNTLLISTDGSFQIQFEYSMLGDKWTTCYRP